MMCCMCGATLAVKGGLFAIPRCLKFAVKFINDLMLCDLVQVQDDDVWKHASRYTVEDPKKGPGSMVEFVRGDYVKVKCMSLYGGIKCITVRCDF